MAITYEPYVKTGDNTYEEIKFPYNVLSDAPNLSEYVTKSGEETISGVKTFTSAPKMDTLENSRGNAMYHFNGSKVYFGQTTFSITLRGNGVRPKYLQNGDESELALYNDLLNYVPVQSGDGTYYSQVENENGEVSLRTFKNGDTTDTASVRVKKDGTVVLQGTVDRPQYQKGGDSAVDIALKSDVPSSDNLVTTDTAQTVSGEKTFTAGNIFTGETKFTNEGYAPTFTDIASGLGKSSCFTRGALMQTITGQIIAPNAAVSDTTHAYNTEVGKIKFQRITGTSNGQPTLADMASIDSTGIKEGSTYLSAKYQSKLSDTQLNAVNSGITSTKVSTYDGYASTISAKLPTSNVSGTSGTLPKFTGTNSIGNSSVTQSSANDITVGGKLIVKSSGSTSGNSYNEGIRVLPASNGWSELFFSNDQTTSGNHEKGWILGKRGAAGATSGAAGDFTIECNGSSGNGLTLYADGSKPRWKNNELAYKSEIPTNYVTTDTEQTDISGAKGFVDDVTFNKDVLFQTGEQTEILKIDTTVDEEAIEIFQQVVVGKTAGTRGQVLTSQGAGNSPKWTTPSDLVQIRVSSVRRFRNTTDSTQPPATYNINVQIEGGLSNLQAGDKIQLCYPKKCKHKTRERFRYKSRDYYQITEYDIAMGYSSFSIPLEIYHRFVGKEDWEVLPPYYYSFTLDPNHRQPWIVRVQRNPIDPVNWIEDNACETVSNICKIIIGHESAVVDGPVTIIPV